MPSIVTVSFKFKNKIQILNFLHTNYKYFMKHAILKLFIPNKILHIYYVLIVLAHISSTLINNNCKIKFLPHYNVTKLTFYTL